MHFGFKGLLCAAVLLVAASPVFASRQCDAAHRLARIHDFYLTLVTEKGTDRTRAAARLYPLIAEEDATSLFKDLKADVEFASFSKALASAIELSQEVITQAQFPTQALELHTANISHLAGLVRKTGCMPKGGGRGQGGTTNSQVKVGEDQTPQSALSPDARVQGFRSDAFNGELPVQTLVLTTAIALAFAICLGLILRSRRLRIYRVNRLPRQETRFSVDFTIDGPEAEKMTRKGQAIDVSLGGMKMKVGMQLDAGARLVLSLPIGDHSASVVWSNAHYAGILFDQNITEPDLLTLTFAKENSP